MIVCVFVYGFLGLAPLVQLRCVRRWEPPRDSSKTSLRRRCSSSWQIRLNLLRRSLLATIKAPDAAIRVRPVQHLHAPRVVLITLFAFAVAAFYVSRVGLASFGRPRLEFSARLGESSQTTRLPP